MASKNRSSELRWARIQRTVALVAMLLILVGSFIQDKLY